MVRGCDREVEISFAFLKFKGKKIRLNLIKTENVLAKANISKEFMYDYKGHSCVL